MTSRALAIALVAMLAIAVDSVHSEMVSGTTGSGAGDRWQSSWLDIDPPVVFKKGHVVKLKLEGSAENVMVRFLPVGSAYDSADGVEGGVRKVPQDKMLILTLEQDHANIRQISVHAGKEAWHRPLGGNNGSITLVGVEYDSK